MFRSHIAAIFALIFFAGLAQAAPPASCAGKYVGVWQHGGTNMATLTRDGQSICSGNPYCLQGTWTCDGNSLTYTNASGTYTYTLQPNGTMTYGSIVVTRIGRASEPASKVNSGQYFMEAARGPERICSYADQMAAAGRYLDAAKAFAAEGDPKMQAEAKQRSEAASARADKCAHEKTASAAASPAKGRSKTSRCLRGRIQAEQLKAAGGDISGVIKAMQDAGCDVSGLN